MEFDESSGFYMGKYFVKIDKADIELLKPFTWRALQSRGKSFYAVTTMKEFGRKRLIRMHRFLIDAAPGEIVDHINRDTMDNRRENLRICTQSMNMRNKGEIRKKSHLPKNIRQSVYGKFIVQFKLNGKGHFSKSFEKLNDAVSFRDQWIKENNWDGLRSSALRKERGQADEG